MFSVLVRKCNNNDCLVDTFNYASCNAPICPACGVCARCGYPDVEHGKYNGDECPNECVECGDLVEPYNGEDRPVCQKCKK